MKGPGTENDFAKKSKEMNNGSIPNSYNNKDYGKKRKAKAHKFSVKNTKTGQLYWAPAVMERQTLTEFLIQENNDNKLLDKITILPNIILSDLKKLISKGAKDLEQNWKDAAELCNTAYHVGQVRRPIPTQRGAWKQYEELLKYSVQQLWNTRGNKGSWRSADTVYSETYFPSIEPLTEDITTGSRFFVKIPGAMDVEIDGKDMSEVIRDLSNKIRRHGGQVEVRHRTREGAVLVVFKNNEELEEIIIQDIS